MFANIEGSRGKPCLIDRGYPWIERIVKICQNLFWHSCTRLLRLAFRCRAPAFPSFFNVYFVCTVSLVQGQDIKDEGPAYVLPPCLGSCHVRNIPQRKDKIRQDSPAALSGLHYRSPAHNFKESGSQRIKESCETLWDAVTPEVFLFGFLFWLLLLVYMLEKFSKVLLHVPCGWASESRSQVQRSAAGLSFFRVAWKSRSRLPPTLLLQAMRNMGFTDTEACIQVPWIWDFPDLAGRYGGFMKAYPKLGPTNSNGGIRGPSFAGKSKYPSVIRLLDPSWFVMSI